MTKIPTLVVAGRRRRLVAALAVGILCTALPLAGQAKGRVNLPGLRGGALTSGDLDRGTTVLVVWAGWSPRCRDIVDRVNGLAGRVGSKARLATVDFQEEPAAIEEFLRGKNLTVPVYLDKDGEFSKSQSVTALPSLLVFQNGEVKLAGRFDAEGEKNLGQLLGL